MALSDLSRRTAAALALVAGVTLCVPGDAAPGRTVWHRDLKSAAAEAQRLNVPMILHFYADWCGPCKKMEGEVLSSPGLTGQLGNRFVGAKINIDEQRDVAKAYKIESLPSDVIVAPDGEVLAHTVGYQSERDYLGRLARLETRFAQTKKTTIATTPQPGSGNTGIGLRPLPGSSNKVKVVSDPAQAAEAAFVGLNGYSPVSLFNKRDWIKGTREHAAAFEGVAYQFTSTDELRQFQDDPEKFAPRILGCDPVVLAETERAIPGSTRFAAYFEGRLFLFVSSATRDTFRQTPEKYGKAPPTVSVDQIEFRRTSDAGR